MLWWAHAWADGTFQAQGTKSGGLDWTFAKPTANRRHFHSYDPERRPKCHMVDLVSQEAWIRFEAHGIPNFPGAPSEF